MKYNQISPELYYSDGNFCAVDKDDVAFLKKAAASSKSHRSRLCFHSDSSDLQQEMLIVAHRSSYIIPHRHFKKKETFSVVEGKCSALLFNESGQVDRVISMSTCDAEKIFFYRMPANVFHSCLIHSEWLVFIETTIGPYQENLTEHASWAPARDEQIEGNSFLRKSILKYNQESESYITKHYGS